MKSRLLIIGLLVALVATTTFGAFAYFSSSVDTSGSITSGTLTLKISDHNGDYADTVALPWDVTGMAPGETKDGYLWMKNVGSVAARQVTFEWKDILNNPVDVLFADHIFLVSVFDSTDPGDQIGAFIPMCDTNSDLKCSLTELAALSGRFSYPYDAVSGAVDPWLPAGQAQWLYMKFEFDPAAGNEFQGKALTYNLKITAEQDQVFP